MSGLYWTRKRIICSKGALTSLGSVEGFGQSRHAVVLCSQPEILWFDGVGVVSVSVVMYILSTAQEVLMRLGILELSSRRGWRNREH